MTQAGTLEISIYQEDVFLMIKIADDGIGMSQEMVDEISFRQWPPATTLFKRGIREYQNKK